jgi:hypothetical protein
MGLNFPDVPTDGQVFNQWAWNAATGAWKPTGGSSGSPGGDASVASIAALKAVNVVADTRIFVAGYYAEGDGGGGWFYGATASAATDNGGTIIAPTSGTGRWLREVAGGNINVKWFGLKGDNTTESLTQLNAARDVAIALTGGLYFPATTGRYLFNTTGLVIPDNTSGLRIFGDVTGDPVGGPAAGSVIAVANGSAIDMTAVAAGGTGSINNIVIENLQLYSSGVGIKALKAWNVSTFAMANMTITGQTAIDMAGTALFNFRNIVAYGSVAGVVFSQAAVGAQSCGPGVWDGGQISVSSGTGPVLSISGDSLGVVFKNLQFTWSNSTAAATITIDGPASAVNVGSITFQQCHAESIYNTTNTGTLFRIGQTQKAGTVVIDGGNFWGHGNGTNYMRDFVQIVAAKHVAIKDATGSKLASVNGFSRSMIRMETTFPTAGDTYNFNGLIYDGSGAMYSDASGVITGTGAKTNETFNNVALDAAAWASKAPLASPTFTGTPAAPTATAGTNTTQLATTAFVTTADNLKAPLASPSFTGIVTSAGLVDLSGAGAGQIKFPSAQNASADVNTLDDYEEGTWTPVFSFATPGNLAVTYGNQLGIYTKIGREVTFVIDVNMSAFTHSTASGVARVTGLPFTSATLNQTSRGGLLWQGVTKASYTDLCMSVAQTGTAILFRLCGSGQGAVDVATTDMPTGGTPRFSGTLTYPAA